MRTTFGLSWLLLIGFALLGCDDLTQPESAFSDDGAVLAADGGGPSADLAIPGDLPAAPDLLIPPDMALPLDLVPPPTMPKAPPSRPATSPANVISLLCDAYMNVPVSTWCAKWSNATVADTMVGADHVKLFTNVVFAGIDFGANYDCSSMKALRIDLWSPDSPSVRIKLVDYGPNGHYDAPGTGDDSESELGWDAATTPAFFQYSWVRLDVSLADFSGLKSTAHIAQIILSGASGSFYVDNVYFHK